MKKENQRNSLVSRSLVLLQPPFMPLYCTMVTNLTFFKPMFTHWIARSFV